MNIAVILSSGVGSRFGGSLPKQYNLLSGKEVISYVIDAAREAKTIDKIVCVASGNYVKELAETYNLETTEGGETRNESFRKGLEYIKERYDCKKVMIFDAVRPFVSGELIDRYITLLDDNQVVVTTKKITDCLHSLIYGVCDREDYVLLASPMAFVFDWVYKYQDANSKLTEVLHQLPKETKTYFYYDFKNNYKVTYKEDIAFLEALMTGKSK